ncbi:uncharacterized protein LOC130679651 [Manis pentadactyla]|uniref:uncharacterized protein LOC130679651 n=1 Tax=Manis pentadactyla TaxID=143292 RepID=UPI00255CE797|nr:uncharacterized protein LOC130679651 [Manis pentadactyla]
MVENTISVLEALEKACAPLPSRAGLRARTEPSSSPAFGPRPPRPSQRPWGGPALKACPARREGPRARSRGPLGAPVCLRAVVRLSWDCGRRAQSRAPDGVPTPASLRPPGSRLLVPPRGPKNTGAAAPVASAACSWRTRCCAPATSSTSTTGCLGGSGVSAAHRHGLHRTRRGGSHSSCSAQARSDRTHGARTAGRVASHYGDRNLSYFGNPHCLILLHGLTVHFPGLLSSCPTPAFNSGYQGLLMKNNKTS